MSGILEVLDGCFAMSHLEDKNSLKSTAVSLSTELLTLPTVSGVQKNTKALLAALHPSKQTYHNYKASCYERLNTLSIVLHIVNSYYYCLFFM